MRILTLAILFFAAIQVNAQKEVKFLATADMGKIQVGEYFDVAFTLTNSKGEQFQAPDFTGFEIVSGPNQSVFTSISNGRMSSEVKYSYGLIPTRKGVFEIGPASIKVGRKTIRSNVLKIEIVEKRSPQGNVVTDDEEPYFIRAELSRDSVFVGQQVRLDYKLYTRIDIDNYSLQKHPEFKDFYTRHFRQRGQVRRELIGNQTYTTKVLKSVALFPQKSGVFDIPPTVFQINIPVDDGRGRSFLLIRPSKTKIVTTEATQVHVRPLPSNAPPDFTGAVGQYELNASIDKRQASTDGAIALRLQIQGNGDAKRVLAPVLDFGEAFEIYEPQILKEEDFQNTGYFQTDKTFEYQIIPLKAGNFEFSPHFTYYDPDTSSFVTLFADTFQVDVKQGAITYTRTERQTKDQKAERGEIRYIQQNANLRKRSTPFFGSWQYWSLIGSPVLAFIGLLGFRNNWWSANGDKSASELRMEKAQKVAITRLKQAEGYMGEQNVRAFYDEISKTLLGYVGDKVQIPASEMSKSNIREKLGVLGVEIELANQYVDLLQTCEYALFGGQKPEHLSGDFEQAKRLIIEVEKMI